MQQPGECNRIYFIEIVNVFIEVLFHPSYINKTLHCNELA